MTFMIQKALSILIKDEHADNCHRKRYALKSYTGFHYWPHGETAS